MVATADKRRPVADPADDARGDSEPDRSLRRLVVFAFICLFIGVGYSTVYRAGLGETERSDFGVYWEAGRAILHGTSIYEAQNTRGWFYMYLPAFAVAITPLSLLPKVVAAGVFYLISLAGLLHAAFLSADLGKRVARDRPGSRPVDRFWMSVLLIVVTGWMWMSGLGRGQASVLLSWLIIFAVHRFVTAGLAGRVGGASALAFATVIRIFPVLLGLWLLVRRQWVDAGLCIAAGLLLILGPSLVFGPRGNMSLLHEWLTTIALPTGRATAESNARYDQMMDPRTEKNQSVQSAFIRTLAPSEEPGKSDARERLARRFSHGFSLFLLGGTLASLLVAYHRHGDREQVAIIGAAAVTILCLLLPPTSWVHNYSLMLLPLAVVVVGLTDPHARRRRAYRAAGVAWAVAAVCGLFPPLYWIGGVTIGALYVWFALCLDLLVPQRLPR